MNDFDLHPNVRADYYCCKTCPAPFVDQSLPGMPQPQGPGRVRLPPDAKFPLRYRDLVGEYFKSVAESQKEGN